MHIFYPKQAYILHFQNIWNWYFSLNFFYMVFQTCTYFSSKASMAAYKFKIFEFISYIKPFKICLLVFNNQNKLRSLYILQFILIKILLCGIQNMQILYKKIHDWPYPQQGSNEVVSIHDLRTILRNKFCYKYLFNNIFF